MVALNTQPAVGSKLNQARRDKPVNGLLYLRRRTNHIQQRGKFYRRQPPYRVDYQVVEAAHAAPPSPARSASAASARDFQSMVLILPPLMP
jgi:hypothetical protein